LIYNIFGAISDEESLIFTYDDLFEYLEAIFGSFKLDDGLRTALKSAKNFIFLGFKFNKWYMKLLLRLVEINKNKAGHTPNDANLSTDTVDFYKDVYKMTFVENNVSDFVHRLFSACQSNLRTPKPMSKTPFEEEIFKMVESNELVKAIDKLLMFFKQKEDKESMKMLTILKANYNSANDNLNMEIITQKEANQAFALVRKGILDMTTEIN